MWTTLGPGVCQQALFTLTSFQPLFGVVPICGPSRPESNAHHARLLRGRVLPACASALSAPAALGCGLAKLDLSAGSSGELVPRAPTHTGGWWSASASGWKYIEPTTVLGGLYQRGKEQLLVPAHLQHHQVLAAASALQGNCLPQLVSDSLSFNISQVNFDFI